jgi:hypothetical protein
MPGRLAPTADHTRTALRHRCVIATREGLHLLGDRGTSLLAGRAVTSVHAVGDQLWALVDGREVRRVAAPHGGDGELVATLPDDATGTCLVVHAGTAWVGGEGAALWRVDGDRPVRVTSFDGAPTSAEWHTPWGGPPAIFSMASSGDDLYVGVHVGGVIRTSDGGRSWSATIDLHDDVHEVVADASGTLWAATGVRGLARSDDRGASWSYLTDGLHAHYLLTVAATSDAVVVGASSGHAARDGALYRFDGDRFVRCGTGLPERLGGPVGPRQLAASGDDVVVALPGGHVLASADGGRNWTPAASGLGHVTEVALL